MAPHPVTISHCWKPPHSGTPLVTVTSTCPTLHLKPSPISVRLWCLQFLSMLIANLSQTVDIYVKKGGNCQKMLHGIQHRSGLSQAMMWNQNNTDLSSTSPCLDFLSAWMPKVCWWPTGTTYRMGPSSAMELKKQISLNINHKYWGAITMQVQSIRYHTTHQDYIKRPLLYQRKY